MSNIKISELPLYTGNTTGAYLVMNNSGQTTTYKVTRENIIGASGTSGTSGTSGVAGSSGTSGSSGSNGSSGTSGDSLFALTGSIWNTTNNVGITGSLIVSGSATITGSLQVTGSVQGNVVPLTITSNTASLNLNSGNFFTLQLVSGSATHIVPSNIKPGQSANILISTTGSATVTFPSSVKQPENMRYVASTGTSKDILSLVSYDTSNVYLISAKTLS